jgi:hypothetical protein
MRRGLISRSLIELPDAVLDSRLTRLRAAMSRAQLDALVIYSNNTRPAAASWLTGFVPYWSEALLVLPPDREPMLVVALTFRVKPWIERTSRVADVIHTPRIGLEAAKLIAAANPSAAVGIVEFDHLAAGVADDLHEGGPGLAFSDASEIFAAVRAKVDPTEVMLATHAASIAERALNQITPQQSGICDVVGAVEIEARRLGAEEIYIAAAVDLARDHRLVRIESGSPAEAPCGESYAVRATVAYKGVWVRRTHTISGNCDRDRPDPLVQEASRRFAAAVALLPSGHGFAQFESFLVEGCRLSQPLEPLMGSRIAAERPPSPGAASLLL